MNALTLNDISVRYGSKYAVSHFSATIALGEMVTILGPSGCGKSSLLKAVAGIESPSSGSIELDGKLLFSKVAGISLPPEKRGVGFVFQSYALWPHMTVFENVAYPLACKKLAKNEMEILVRDALSLFRLAHKADSHPTELSGGEQQRVALARAIVMQPKVLLMDEPLSSLDAKLRIVMRSEIQRVQKQLGITCLYVTHDQSEALALSDRIIVMQDGAIRQSGKPVEIYDKPASVFVADFIGQANTLYLQPVSQADGLLTARLDDGSELTAPCDFTLSSFEDPVVLLCRPQYISLSSDTKEGKTGTILHSEFTGTSLRYRLAISRKQDLWAEIPYKMGMPQFSVGDRVAYAIQTDAAWFLPRAGGGIIPGCTP